MFTVEHSPGQPIFDNYWKVLRLAEGGGIVHMMNSNRILPLTDCYCQDEKYCDEETEKNWSDGEHCYLHPSIQRKISDYSERIVFGTAVDYRPRWGHNMNVDLRFEN